MIKCIVKHTTALAFEIPHRLCKLDSQTSLTGEDTADTQTELGLRFDGDALLFLSSSRRLGQIRQIQALDFLL